MNKLWILIKSEYNQVVKKKSFLIGILLTPLFMVLVTVVPALLMAKKSATTEKTAIIDLDKQGIGEKFKEKLAEYKLDDGGPAYEVAEILTPDPLDSVSIATMKARLDSLILAKEIKSYLVISPDIENKDTAFIVAKSFGFRTSGRFERRLSDIVASLRLEKAKVGVSIDSVLHLTRSVILSEKAPGGRERDFLTVYLGGIIFVMIIFMTVIGYGQILMRAIIEEKNSRIMEVLVSSVSSFQLMASKIIGLGLANLTQVAIWIVIGMGIYAFRGNLDIRADIAEILFNPVFIFFFVVYLILGYIMYSSLFALIGAIVNTDKEAQNFIFPITMSLIFPVILASYFIQEPDSTTAIVLSLIPFFTPTMMILRLSFMGVETFSLSNPIILEAIIGIVITALADILIIWVTARIFRIGILMYGKRPTLPEIVKWVRHG